MPIIQMTTYKISTPGPTPWQPGANTIAYYPLNGDADDYSGNGWNGTWGNGAYYAQGIDGKQCGDFTRAYDTWITSQCNVSPSTVSLFMKWIDLNQTNQDWRQIIGMTTNWESGWCFRCQPVSYDSSTLVGRWYIQNSSGGHSYYNTSIIDLDWHHYCITTDGTTTHFYVDGVDLQQWSGTLTGNSTFQIDRPATGAYRINAYLQNIILESAYWTQQDIQDYLSLFTY